MSTTLVPHHQFVCGAEKTLAFGTFDGKLDAIAEPVVATASNKQTVRFNDGVCDRKGRFITGTMSVSWRPCSLKEKQTNKQTNKTKTDEADPEACVLSDRVEGDDTESRGQLFSLDPESKKVTILLEDVLCSNGQLRSALFLTIAETSAPLTSSTGTGWSPDDKIMYYVDSPRGVIHKYDYDLETGKLSNKSVFATNTFGDGGSFDGLCMGVDGSVFVSRESVSKLPCVSRG